ncbi:uncharacterized protein AMSG_01667 [Thecamonas trahens ATCC 50062]|uniref:Bet v I allergen n=1 Tax=Thecamonas trahens ATCC 50062 TaxID=461836 RepID=A0A0L0DRA4_THETB|nr:hypothetical protein AMSG_01667 [Thecamonas trahens ATCC 50062]KNC54815.1 hypothetical protein AMSG_01667 [Thecamonas trahens ATCC 50062]|eukprot:XP_013761714.1 hypothetical protein AMSG_01667 [Thecamonas trahens ATCC 50062]
MSCSHAVFIPSSADSVWATIRSFHDLSWAPNVVTSCEGDGEPTTVGATRVINGVFAETLTVFDDEGKTFSYRIDDGPGTPVASDLQTGEYIGTVRVIEINAGPEAADGACVVEWTSSYSTVDNAAVKTVCDGIYHALLNEMRNSCASA